jgi:hypothetical protein
MHFVRQVLFAAVTLAVSTPLSAQVTTATLYGVIKDPSGAVLPGVSITATHQGTGQSRSVVSDERGEFALPALPVGTYTLKLELPGFKTYTNQGMQLNSGQNVRQTFVLEVGQVSENITVAETAPLVETASSAQQRSLGTTEVSELPLARRNVTGVLALAPGVDTSANNGTVRLNGVAAGGTGITVDGTEANSNPEGRAMSQYGGQNQIDVMSIEAVAEVQVVKGILPAEYGGVVGGQINMISRSGTNAFHGSAFENYQGDMLFARDPFLPSTQAKPKDKFNQFGGSLGGPIVRNRAFFFATYEGYRETAGVTVQGTVPTQALRDQILAALPFPETKIAMDPLPLPNTPVNADVGRYIGVGTRTRSENHVVAKSDVSIFNGNLSSTYSRSRPYTISPSATVNGANDTIYPNEQDRVAAQYVKSRGSWVSESRFGYNRTKLQRLSKFFDVKNPNKPETGYFDQSMPLFTTTGLFSTPSSELYDLYGVAISAEQKVSHIIGGHNVKTGFRWVRQLGNRSNPQNPSIRYQNKADLLANRPNVVVPTFGAPPHGSHLDEFGFFLQDDWRVNKRLVLNLGLRYDYYGTMHVYPTSDLPVEIVNLDSAKSLTPQRVEFGSLRDPQKPYNPDANNFGPRAGFAWTMDSKGTTILRGGSGVLFSPQLPAAVRQSAAHPEVPFRVQWNKTDVDRLGLKWPMYNADLRQIVIKDSGGAPSFFSIFDVNLKNPYTVQSMVSVERAIGREFMFEVGYVRTDGRSFPLQRWFSQIFDRQTGARPAGWNIGNPGGYYVDSGQTMNYNALQTSVRKRMSNGIQFDFNYTLSKGDSTQGGDIQAYYQAGLLGSSNIQDFFNPEADRAPNTGDNRHRVTADIIYDFPWFRTGNGILPHTIGGWQISSIFRSRSGNPLNIYQASGIQNSRPDYIGGQPVLQNWKDTLQYFNTAAFVPVPISPITQATIRPGNLSPFLLHGPAYWVVDIALAKNFRITESKKLQIRADAFNAFNHVNLNDPDNGLLSATFGKILSAAAARTGQIGARFTF